jgi:hypothetical protein
MNQHQRKFLLEAIEKQYTTEHDALRKRRPKAPSLNNYLIAAVLDGSFVLKDAAHVRSALVERVRDLGKDEALLSNHSRSWRNSDEPAAEISLPAHVLFDLPPGYAASFEAYEPALRQWQSEMDALEAAVGAMRLRVQIGSDKALAALVDQADQLCSLSLTASNQLLLRSGG